jgi:methionine biosynthesis protein MetW
MEDQFTNTPLRPDLELICEWIKPNTRILDLGCGDGALLSHLHKTRNVTGYGLEIDHENILKCIIKGVQVIQTNLDEGITEFFDENSFDYVVMTQTLQAIQFPEKLLIQMMRIGKEGIVTFPNMAYWKNRIQLALGGHMPITRTLPNTWHDTPNIHLCSLQDFEALCDSNRIKIIQRAAVDHAHRYSLGSKLFPNLLGEIALYRFCKNPG